MCPRVCVFVHVCEVKQVKGSTWREDLWPLTGYLSLWGPFQ